MDNCKKGFNFGENNHKAKFFQMSDYLFLVFNTLYFVVVFSPIIAIVIPRNLICFFNGKTKSLRSNHEISCPNPPY